MHRSRLQSAFSLVELSIVLVILGLLTGGILAGQSLIRAAELRSITADFSRYKAAMLTFRDKYMGMPGDFANATKFWTSAGGTGADAACLNAMTASSPATCNGDGDGHINNISGYSYYERFLAWKHLANAGLIEGAYQGRTNGAAGTYVAVIGLNVPASKLSNGFFDTFYETASGTINFAASNLTRNFINIYGNTATNGIILPEEAWNLDTKLDDGNPVYGMVISAQKDSAYGTNCTTANTAPASYDLTIKSPNCFLRFAAD